MRLINTKTLLLETFPDSRRAPPYAILSHTWGRDEDEVKLQDMGPGVLDSPAAAKPGFYKIKMTCHIALKGHGLEYAWVDTCCIDKTSSAELSEAINSMFKWYQESAVCFAFLEDWEPDEPSFDHCRWWTRGWTLQELIAPRDIVFFDQTWEVRGDLASLCTEISQLARIKEGVLWKRTPLSTVPVAVRMSWASRRETAREEDIAYCLMGIFDINMPMLYGEGSKAFIRLQEEIIKTTPDRSLFAWEATDNLDQPYMGILAPSPDAFSCCSGISGVIKSSQIGAPLKLSTSNLGVKTNMALWNYNHTGLDISHFAASRLQWITLVFKDRHRDRERLGIYLKNVGGSRYVRAFPTVLSPEPTPSIERLDQQPSIYLLPRLTLAQSDAYITRQLSFKISWAKLSTLPLTRSPMIHPPESMTQLERNGCLQAAQNGSITVLYFQAEDASELSSFSILCRFYNDRGMLGSGFWECDVLEAGEEAPSLKDFKKLVFALSDESGASSSISKTLDLAGGRVRRGAKTRAVTVTLETEFTSSRSDHVPMFSLDLRMDVS